MIKLFSSKYSGVCCALSGSSHFVDGDKLKSEMTSFYRKEMFSIPNETRS